MGPDVRITHIGGPTTLIEVGEWRLLTDPTFDEAGRSYRFGYGTGSRKLVGPSVAARDLPPIDAVLLSHDHHADNLDDAGRALLPSVGTVVTTVSGAARLGGNAHGLAPWSSMRLTRSGRLTIGITAMPCRHGPPLSRPIVGDVIGFAVSWEGQKNGVLWISGDTVFYEGVEEVARRLHIGTVLLHLGGVRFPLTGPLRYTMTATDAVRVFRLMKPRTLIPIHYEGWGHFQEHRAAVESAFALEPLEVRRSLRWLDIGRRTAIAC